MPLVLSPSLVATAAFLLGATSLAAQDPADTTRATPQQLAPITTTVRKPARYRTDQPTAARQPLSWRETPQAVSTVTQAQVADQAIQSLAEAARYMPGVTFAQGEGHRDAPTIRGNASTSSFFVDGMRDDVQYLRDLYTTERVEAVKGPSALAFGRGVGGGILNRVSKSAGFGAVRELTVQGGSFGARRGTLDLGDKLSERVAVRVNGVFEDTELFRRDVGLQRWGVAPTATWRAGDRTTVTFSAERFEDERTVDRGLPSRSGLPLAADRRTFFGNPALSRSSADVATGALAVQQLLGGAMLRSRTQYGWYDKFYSNVYPGAVSADGATVRLEAYDNATERFNLLHQNDLMLGFRTGPIRHQLMTGVDVGRQVSANVRNTGFFNNTATSVSAPIGAPITTAPVTFRQNATDANNRSYLTTLAVFAQNQLALTPWASVLAGVRMERFAISLDNFRTGQTLQRTDDIISPRLGLVLTPAGPLSVYGSWSVAQLPSSGEQFASLTPTQATLVPERFTNAEVGAKLELARGLAASVAAYQLDRTNTTAPSPDNPAVIVQTGSQRSRGIEADLAGTPLRGWQVIAGYAYQDARITSRTTAAVVGARVPIVPRHAVSLWNRVDLPKGFGVGLGVIHQSAMFAAIDNAVTLPGWTRVDAAAFVPVTRAVHAQVNVENVFDRSYFSTAHNNNNLTPGTPRLVRVSLTTRF